MSFFTLPELFKRWRSPPPEKFVLPYDLKPEEFSQLRTLRHAEEWASFQRVLDEVVKLNGEILLVGKGDESLHFYRGLIHGIRKAATLIDEIIAAQTLHESEERKRKDAGNPRSNRTNALNTFGTSNWVARGP